MATNYFTELNNIDVSSKVEKKGNLSYLSWVWAWCELKKLHPDAAYTIYENADGLFYHTDGKTCWVKTGVTVNGIEHIEYLPVMDYKNRSIPLENVTSMDVNKAIQRSLTKAVARHGLGLYIYAGEDLPEETAEQNKAQQKQQSREEIKADAVKRADELKKKNDNIKEWVANIRAELQRTGVSEKTILDAAKITSLEQMNEGIYQSLMSKLKITKDKAA